MKIDPATPLSFPLSPKKVPPHFHRNQKLSKSRSLLQPYLESKLIYSPNKNRTNRFRLIVLITFIAGTVLAGNGAQTGRYILKSRDLRSFRRLILTNPAHRDSSGFVIPRLTVNYPEGEFTITLSPVDTNLYYGARLIRDTDNQPLELTVNYPDSATILIVGRTDKLALIADYYAISANKFIFDLYRTQPSSSDLRSEALSLFIADDYEFDSKAADEQPVASASETYWLRTPRMILALKIAGFFLLLVIILQIVRINRKQKKGTHPKPARPGEPINTGGIINTPPANDEDPVWTLAREQGISYDEAMIIMNMQQKKIDVRT